MTSRLEAPCRNFRDMMRKFRRSSTDLIYEFRHDIAAPFEDRLSPIISGFDKELKNLLHAELDNDKVHVLNTIMDTQVKQIEIDHCFDFLKEQVTSLVMDMIEKVNDLSKEIDESNQGKLQKPREELELVKKHLDDFSCESPPDVPKTLQQIETELQKPKYFDSTLVEKLHRIFTLGCTLKLSEKSMKTFEVPPILTAEQVEILKLKERIDKLEKSLKEKDDKIRTLQADKMNFRRENINFKNENSELKRQCEAYEKRIRVLQNKVEEVPAMKNGLECIFSILRTEHKPDDQ